MTSSSSASSRKSCASAKADRRRRLARFLCLVFAFAAGGGGAEAYVRIVLGGRTLSWPSNTIDWRLNNAGSDDITDGSHEVAIRKAFDAWEAVSGSKIKFQEGARTSSKDISDPNKHIVLFDENNSTGLFPAGSGIVAMTPIWYQPSSGQITDADIVFNGKDWSWATDGNPGAFDVQDVLTHEIGHFIGLDHSPSISASLWPYVSTGQYLHRSLSTDDQAGVIAIASKGQDAVLKGKVRKNNGNDLKGAFVAAVRVDDGRMEGSALSGEDGTWKIRGLSGGDYYLYAAPVEGGFTSGNLTGDGTVQVSFGADFYGGHENPTPVSVQAGKTKDIGSWSLRPNSALKDNASTPVVVEQGSVANLTIWGENFDATMDIWDLAPGITLSNVSSGSSWIQCTVSVASTCPEGEYDLYLSDDLGDFEAVSGILTVVPPRPVLSALDVTLGSDLGGTSVTLSGTNLPAEGYVLFGGKEADSVSWVDARTVVAVTPPHPPGTVDVSIHAASGQQSRLENAFTFAAVPNLDSLFPEAGQTSGGTTVILNGTGFAPEIVVGMGGTPATVEYLSDKLLRVTTPAHAAGTVDLTLQNPGGEVVTVPGAFTFTSNPDPVVSALTPGSGASTGGSRVRILGENLGETWTVRFGVDPVTAAGGKDAQEVLVLGASEVESVTPAWQPGEYGVLVILPSGQGAMAPATFQFQAQASSSSGGGGGCGGVATGGGAATADGLLYVLLFLVFWAGRRRR